MGGINIDSALQVGFILKALLSKYQAVVQEFRLGCHAFTKASLQTVVGQCINYYKDPWKGPVIRDGKPACTPSANAAGADSNNPHSAIVAKSFNYHFGCWKKALGNNKGKCMMCLDTACNPVHKTCNCPILKKLRLKLEKWTAALNAASCATTNATTLAPSATPPSASTPLPNNQSGFATIPGGFTASAEQASYNSGDKFDYEGKADGDMYGTANPNASSAYSDPVQACTDLPLTTWGAFPTQLLT
jgi:hypothetical protein